MPLYNFDIGEKDRIGSRFLSDVRDELQRALAAEKEERKITQQQIAEKLETSRAVINRQITGLENIGIKRVAEILWAIGWEPYFEARKIPKGSNYDSAQRKDSSPVPPQKSERIIGAPDPEIKKLWDELASKPAPVPV